MARQSLQDFVEEASGQSHLRVEHDFGDGFVRLKTSEADRRQAAQDIQRSEHIVLELLRNSRDAHATHVFMALSKEGCKRHITVIDDGDGIPANMHGHVFEPRVTSKLDTSHMDAWGLHGRGMALYSISQNSEVARVVDSSIEMGCAITVQTDVTVLPEKKDQSSFPSFVLGENGQVNVRGPRNIVRTACEFAIESRERCSVYVGSPAEIAATLLAFGTSTLSAIDRLFCEDIEDIPIVKRLATASDPSDFERISRSIGLDLSTRTARRILDGQISDVCPLLELVTIEQPAAPDKKRRKSPRSISSGRQVKIQKPDADAFASAVKGDFQEIARQYYLEGNVDPTVRTMPGRIIVTIPIVEKP